MHVQKFRVKASPVPSRSLQLGLVLVDTMLVAGVGQARTVGAVGTVDEVRAVSAVAGGGTVVAVLHVAAVVQSVASNAVAAVLAVIAVREVAAVGVSVRVGRHGVTMVAGVSEWVCMCMCGVLC